MQTRSLSSSFLIETSLTLFNFLKEASLPRGINYKECVIPPFLDPKFAFLDQGARWNRGEGLVVSFEYVEHRSWFF